MAPLSLLSSVGVIRKAKVIPDPKLINRDQHKV